jgi:hypothetical protein
MAISTSRSKWYRCSCLYHHGKSVKCEIVSRVDHPPLLCPYGKDDPDWQEVIHKAFLELPHNLYRTKEVDKDTDKRFKKNKRS